MKLKRILCFLFGHKWSPIPLRFFPPTTRKCERCGFVVEYKWRTEGVIANRIFSTGKLRDLSEVKE